MSLVPRGHHPEGWMVVFITYNEPEAHIVSGRLANENIHSWHYREPLGNAIGITFGPLGEVRILVSPEDYQAALDILAVDLSDMAEDDDDEDYDQDQLAD